MTSCLVTRSISSMRATSNVTLARLLPDRLRRLLRDHAELGQRVAGVRLDLEPDAEAGLRLPDRGHLGAGIAGDHRAFPWRRAGAVYRKRGANIETPCAGARLRAQGPTAPGERRVSSNNRRHRSWRRHRRRLAPRCICKRGRSVRSSIAPAPRRARRASATPASCRARRSSPTRFRARSARSFAAALNRDPRAQIRYSALPCDRAVRVALFPRLLAGQAPGRRAGDARAWSGAASPNIARSPRPPARSRCCARAAGSRCSAPRAARISRSPTPRRTSPSACRASTLSREQTARAGAASRRGRQGRRAFHRPDDHARSRRRWRNPTPTVRRARRRVAQGRRAHARAVGRRLDGDDRDGPLQAREAVVALGPWSGELAAALWLSLAVRRQARLPHALRAAAARAQPAGARSREGLRRHADGARPAPDDRRRIRAPRRPAFAGPSRPAGAVRARAFPLAERLDPDAWLGERPCLPDMLPVIGPAPRHKGLWFDFGHQHLGLTLGPGQRPPARGNDDGRDAVRRSCAVSGGAVLRGHRSRQ